jgi:hypothetical protein
MNTRSWFRITLFNLSAVALLGLVLRSKILFSLPWLSHKNIVNAHSHFAFGGWVTVSLLTLFLHRFDLSGRSRFISRMVTGLFASSVGMVLSFPFLGYSLLSIAFSTLFILFTYGYTWEFIALLRKSQKMQLHGWLALASLACLVISSAGPFTLAYVLASGSSDTILYKDSLYFYLHFQYNGFFSLTVLSLLAHRASTSGWTVKWTAIVLMLSIVPSFFLSLLWHAEDVMVRSTALAGVVLVLLGMAGLVKAWMENRRNAFFENRLARQLAILAMFSFLIKSVLQAGTFIPALGHAVFGLRPVIIGFLHLVFLGLVSFYILAEYLEAGLFRKEHEWLARTFLFAVVGQELLLLIQGGGLLMGKTAGFFNWGLWVFAILLFASSFSMAIMATKPASAIKKNSC